MTAEVQPYTAVPGVRIDDVIVGDRARKDYGDLTSLMESIAEHGLLQPIGVLAGNRLLFGGRRLEACRRLGWVSIPFVVPATQADAVSLLKAERDENTCRKDMNVSEKVAVAAAIEELERPKAHERQAHGMTAPGRSLNASGPGAPSVPDEDYRRSSDIAADAVGMSRKTYERARVVVSAATSDDLPSDVREAAQAAQTAMDAGDLSVRTALRKVNVALGRSPESTSAPAADEADTDIRDTAQAAAKVGTRKGQSAVRERSQRIRDLAGSGHASAQIARELGLSEGGVKAICKRDGIDVPADRMLGRTRRHFDSDRFVEQTVLAAEPTPDLMAMVNFAALNRDSLQRWIDSLSKSVRALQSLKRALERELTQ